MRSGEAEECVTDNSTEVEGLLCTVDGQSRKIRDDRKPVPLVPGMSGDLKVSGSTLGQFRPGYNTKPVFTITEILSECS